MTPDRTNPASVPTAPLRYEPSFETVEKDEAQTIDGMNQTLHRIQQTVYDDSGRALRGVHAKSHGILRGELQIPANLPPLLAQGLFARAATYPLVMRFSTVPGEILDDAVSTPRGLAIKIVGVEGTRLPGSESQVTQDFVLVNGPAFGAPTAKAFGKNLKLVAATTDKAPGLKKVLSAVLRGAETIAEKLGHPSGTLLALGGQPETNLLGETYYSQAPLLFGEHVVKIALAPVSPQLVALHKAPVDLKGKPNGLREAVVDFFRTQGGEWELRVQFCTDLKTMPIEDASKVWPEDRSPYVPVARVSIAPQLAWSEAKSAAVDDAMAFNPWHGLAAHRPLGSVMRVRKSVYEVAAHFRAEKNGRAISEPRSLDDIPA